LHYVAHALLAGDGETPDIETSQQHGASAEGQSLDGVGAVANATVEEDGHFLLDCGGDGGERVECGDGSVDLAASVVGDDDGVDAVVEGQAGVVGVQDSFQQNGQTSLPAEPGEIAPGEGGVREQSCPEANGGRGIGLRRLRETRAEDRIAEVVRESVAKKEWKVRMLEIAFAPSEHGGVESNDERGVSGLFRALQQAGGEFVIFAPIELEPPRGGGHGVGDFFKGARRHGTENEGDTQGCGGAGDGNFGVRMNDVLHADGAEQNGRGKSMAEEVDGEVALGNVAQHARDNPPAIKSGEVGARAAFAAGASGDVIVSLRWKNFGGLFFELREWNRDGEFLSRQAELVDLELALHAGAGGGGTGDGVGQIGHGDSLGVRLWSGNHSILGGRGALQSIRDPNEE
jgi:hypothetical protein